MRGHTDMDMVVVAMVIRRMHGACMAGGVAGGWRGAASHIVLPLRHASGSPRATGEPRSALRSARRGRKFAQIAQLTQPTIRSAFGSLRATGSGGGERGAARSRAARARGSAGRSTRPQLKVVACMVTRSEIGTLGLRRWASPHECGGQLQAFRCGLMSP